MGLLRPATVAPGSALALPTTHPAAGTTRASIVSTLPTATTPSEGATHPTPTLAAAALASSSLASTSGRLHAERRTQLSVVRLCRRWHVHHGRMHGPQVGRVQLQGVLRTATPRFTALPRIGPRLVPFLDHPLVVPPYRLAPTPSLPPAPSPPPSSPSSLSSPLPHLPLGALPLMINQPLPLSIPPPLPLMADGPTDSGAD